jgi:vacuolar-type H+-ATPase subunit B/Vma2
MGALALGCSGKTHSNESVPASKMDGETAPVPECQDYARALRTCLAQTGVPAADALATAESNARAPITLSSSELAAQAAGCVRARQQLATACR